MIETDPPARHSSRFGATAPIFLFRALALGAALGSLLIVSTAVGPAGRGAVAGFTVLLLFASVGLGFGTGAVVFLRASRNPESGPALVGAMLAWSALVFAGSLVLAVIASHVGLLYQFVRQSDPWLLLLLAAGATGQYISLTAVQLLIGLGRSFATAFGFLLVPLLALLGNAWAAFTTTEVVVYLAIQALAWISGAALLLLTIGLRPQFGRARFHDLRRSGSRAWLGDIANALSYRLDILLLGLLTGAYAVGIYTFAVQLLEPVWIVATSIATGYLVEQRAELEEVRRRRVVRATLAVAAISAVGLVVLLALAPVVVDYINRGFEESMLPAVILAPGVLLLSMSKVLAAYQLGAGRLWLSSVVAGVSLLVTTLGDLALMPSFGAVGASIASSLGYGVSAMLWLAAFRFSSGYGRRVLTGIPGT